MSLRPPLSRGSFLFALILLLGRRVRARAVRLAEFYDFFGILQLIVFGMFSAQFYAGAESLNLSVLRLWFGIFLLSVNAQN